MPKIETQNFGPLEYQQNAVVVFPAGLPGFEEERGFVVVEQPDTKPLIFLQSLTQPDLCFLTLPVLAVDHDYQLSISPEDLYILELPEEFQPVIGTDVLCLAILSLAEDRPPTANLLAPLVVNLKTRRAVQAIQVDTQYSHQHPLLEEPEC